MNTKTKELTLIGLMAALTCIAGPLSLPLPFSPVPISLTNLAIYFSVYILGMKRGTISYLVYLLLGLVGLPVFSAFTSGPAKLFGPTGGYLIGFIFIAQYRKGYNDKNKAHRKDKTHDYHVKNIGLTQCIRATRKGKAVGYIRYLGQGLVKIGGVYV